MVPKGSRLSLETRAKMSESHKGRHPTPEMCAKISKAKKGSCPSPETRAKISERLKEIYHSPEGRAKLSQRRKGKRSGPAHARWKGGRIKASRGYVRIWDPSHPRASKTRYVLEHIVVWEQAHGRVLPDDHVVHHINGIRDDNRPENLLACPQGNHHYALLLQALKARIRILEAENKRLKTQGKLWN